jgi:hypothetical protein
MVLAVCSISDGEVRPPRHQFGTSAATASWTWHTVSSGFFFPQVFSDARQEQVAHTGQDQVPLEAQPSAAFPLVESDFLFLISEAPLHAPTRHIDLSVTTFTRYGVARSVVAPHSSMRR